ncbi:MAG TPA: DEAD/DEAH box helicase [Vicinamibacterales bacterium]|jgi:ATP-dependent RNA helicase DeaD|nr:DEAD/DEAH box helicase [Vicinamibacterales bacterium]
MPSSRTPSSKGGFPVLGLSDTLLAAVTALGYEEPTPVQRATIPIMLAGRDLLAQAATGTGKTAAFALPMIQRVTERDPRAVDKKPRLAAPPGGLVLVPTRELAMQVSEAIHKYADGTGVIVVPLYGGAGMEQQIRALQRGAHIVVATPGRALDHIRRTTLRLDGIHVLVLDEGDEMLDMGFAEDIEQILDATPTTRQTALFSATLPARILKIAERHLRKPERVTIAAEKVGSGTLPRVRQVAYVVRRDQKPAALDRILDMEHPRTAIVFCRTRLAVDTLVETLNAHGYRAEALHGGMQQRQRDAVMNRVRAGKTDLLMATDVAARGLDIEHVSHVVNYDLPADPESYVHRIGRTGRAGRVGTAITLADPREHRLLRTIERFTKQKIDVHPVPTVKDLRARRLEQLTAALRERLAAGDFDEMRTVVAALADDFDVMDIAAAAVKMAHGAAGDDDREVEIAAAPSAPALPGGRDRGPAGGHAREGVARVFFGAGKKAGIRPGDLVGAIAGESGVPSSAIGGIRIAENFSVVEVPDDLADAIIAAVGAGTLRGKKVKVRRDRDA